jgi:UDP-N-acetylmuramate dehydrogenase
MIVEHNVSLAPHNSFGIVAKARELVRVRDEADVLAVLADPPLAGRPKFVLGGGSNIVLTGDVRPLVLKVEIPGRRVVEDGPRATIV